MPAAAIPEGDEMQPADKAIPEGQKQGTLLVVDDDEGNREILARRLGRQGYTVLTAENGTKALEIARSTEELDLVLLDVIMPVLGDVIGADEAGKEDPKEVAVGHKQLRLGDELASDIKTQEGTLVVRAGGIVSELRIEKLKNFADMVGIEEPILIKFKRDPIPAKKSDKKESS